MNKEKYVSELKIITDREKDCIKTLVAKKLKKHSDLDEEAAEKQVMDKVLRYINKIIKDKISVRSLQLIWNIILHFKRKQMKLIW